MLLRLVVVILALVVSGCGITGGLTRSESLANAHPLFLTAKRDKGEILLQEGLDYLREGSFERFQTSMQAAFEFYDDDREKQAEILRYQGKAHLDRNEYDQALARYNQALEAARASGNKAQGVLATTGLADCYKKIGDADKAMEILNNAQQQAEREHRVVDPRIVLGMAETLALQERMPQALDRLKRIASANLDERLRLVYHSLRGLILARLGNHDAALGDFGQALTLARASYSTPEIVDILNNRGFSQAALRRFDEATRSFQEGLGLLNVMQLSYPEKQLAANYGLGLVNQEQLRLPQALRYYLSAITATEELRESLGSSEFRSLYLAGKTAAYERAIELLAAGDSAAANLDGQLSAAGANGAEAAFYYAESTKARSFLELLAKARANALADRIPRELAVQEQRLVGTIRAIQSSPGGQSEAQQTLLKRSRQELQGLIATLRRLYPDYAAIRYPEPVTARTVPLRANEQLLAFKVNPEATYLWLLEQGTRPMVVRIAIRRDDLDRKVAAYRRGIEHPERLGGYDQVAARELGTLLLGQVVDRLDRNKQVIIVPDGVLNLLPFEALATATGGYLGDSYRISYYPSASVMTAMRRSQRPVQLSQPFFGLGDPVYDEADPRYRSTTGAGTVLAAAGSGPNLRSVLLRNGFSLNRLPETRDELLAIGSLFGYPQGTPHIKLDMQASKHELLKTSLSGYRFVHFATHGLLSGDLPYILEPALVLSQPGVQRPEDGFLKMSDVLELKLNADAVVLSACKTALGKEVAGEGVVGLSRAFMLAGARSVIVSLWSVESSSTAELMKFVYANLQAGKSKEEALRLAKESLKRHSEGTSELQRGLSAVRIAGTRQADSSHPFFWAPFILIGEWD